MHIIRNNGKIFRLQEDVSSGTGTVDDITLNTENIIYETPVEFVIVGGHAGASLQLKEWESFSVLCGSGYEADGVPQLPQLRRLNHTYINDWDEALNEFVPNVLPEYADAVTARAAGLSDGQYYRTGDFVKQLFTAT